MVNDKDYLKKTASSEYPNYTNKGFELSNKYYRSIEKNFIIYNSKGGIVKNKFGFVDIICRKK